MNVVRTMWQGVEKQPYALAASARAERSEAKPVGWMHGLARP